MTDELPKIMARAAAVAAASTLRYGRVLAGLTARHQGSLAEAMGMRRAGAPGTPVRVLAEDVRAYFREVGEAACQEARHLQAELDAIGEEVAQAAETAGPQGPYRRPHKAKE
jgi:hypothetical protein